LRAAVRNNLSPSWRTNPQAKQALIKDLTRHSMSLIPPPNGTRQTQLCPRRLGTCP